MYHVLLPGFCLTCLSVSFLDFPVFALTKVVLIHHSLCPQTKISFIRNSAKLKGAAIFIASLSNCQWDELPPYHNLSRSLRWDRKKFVFSENWLGSADGDDKMADSNHDDDIATDTEAFVITSSHKNDAAFQV